MHSTVLKSYQVVFLSSLSDGVAGTIKKLMSHYLSFRPKLLLL